MKKKIMLGFFASCCIASQMSADPLYQVSGGIGYAQYELENYETFTYPQLNLAFNAGWSDYFVHVGTSVALSTASASGTDDIGSHDDKLDRTTLSLNFGYRFYQSLSAFIGINYAANDIDTSYAPNYAGYSSVTTTTKELGYHIGLAGTVYQWGNYGVVNAKGALSLASMDVSYSDNLGQSFSESSSSGNGYDFGVGWVGIINASMTYYIDLDLYRYSYKINDVTFKSNETVLKGGVAYTF